MSSFDFLELDASPPPRPVVQRCPDCGTPASHGEEYCGQCGTRIEVGRQLDLDHVPRRVPSIGVVVPTCPQCGTPAAPQATVCAACTALLSSGEPVRPHVALPVRPPSVHASRLFCPTCGAYNNLGDKICHDCQGELPPSEPQAAEAHPAPPPVEKPSRRISLD